MIGNIFKFIQGQVGICRSFFLVFVPTYICSCLILVVLKPPIAIGMTLFFIVVGGTVVGTGLSAFRTVTSSDEGIRHRIFAGVLGLIVIGFVYGSLYVLKILFGP